MPQSSGRCLSSQHRITPHVLDGVPGASSRGASEHESATARSCPVRDPTAKAGGLHGSPCWPTLTSLSPPRGSDTGECIGTGGWHLSPPLCGRWLNRRTGFEPVLPARKPLHNLVEVSITPNGATQRGGSSLALHHQKPAPVRGKQAGERRGGASASVLKGGVSAPQFR